MSEEAAEALRVEAAGETVGEAKWHALRELEKRAPGLDKAGVRFEILSEGKRGLLGVGYSPARVAATVAAEAAPTSAHRQPALGKESELAASVRELVGEIAAGLGISCRLEIVEDEEKVTASLTGPELGLLIGRHGQTIDAVQYLVNAILFRAGERKLAVVDAAGYRDRRRSVLESLAVRSAELAKTSGGPVDLDPMTSVERRIVHLCLKEYPGVATRSVGDEPNRHVVVEPV